MIYRGQGFRAVVWFGSYPHHLLSVWSVIDRRHTGLRKGDNLLTGEGGGGESNPITAARKPVHCKSFNTLWNRGILCAQQKQSQTLYLILIDLCKQKWGNDRIYTWSTAFMLWFLHVFIYKLCYNNFVDRSTARTFFIFFKNTHKR